MRRDFTMFILNLSNCQLHFYIFLILKGLFGMVLDGSTGCLSIFFHHILTEKLITGYAFIKFNGNDIQHKKFVNMPLCRSIKWIWMFIIENLGSVTEVLHCLAKIFTRPSIRSSPSSSSIFGRTFNFQDKPPLCITNRQLAKFKSSSAFLIASIHNPTTPFLSWIDLPIRLYSFVH